MTLLTRYITLKALNYFFGAVAYAPAKVYFGLSITYYDDESGIGTITEPTGGSYARVEKDNNKTTWSTATAGTDYALENAIDITFPESTGAWGTIVSLFISDASTAGNVLWWDSLSTPFDVPDNTLVKFVAGDINVTSGFSIT